MKHIKNILICGFLTLFSCGENKKVNLIDIDDVKVNNTALLIGMRKTSLPKFSNIATSRSKSNIKRIKKILEREDFEDIEVIDSPTDSIFLKELKKKIERLNDEDFLVVYYYGHGGQLPDDATGYDNEVDDMDETFVTFNRQVRDDEVNLILRNSKSMARVLFIVDACNSETSVSFTGELEHIQTLDYDEFSLDLLYLGATNDGKQIPPDTFSKIIEDVYDKGKFKGDYLEFEKEITKKARRVRGMSPQLEIKWASSDFTKQKPFKTN